MFPFLRAVALFFGVALLVLCATRVHLREDLVRDARVSVQPHAPEPRRAERLRKPHRPLPRELHRPQDRERGSIGELVVVEVELAHRGVARARVGERLRGGVAAPRAPDVQNRQTREPTGLAHLPRELEAERGACARVGVHRELAEGRQTAERARQGRRAAGTEEIMLRADGFQTREGANALGDQRLRQDDRAGVAEPAVGDGSKRLAAARGPERVRGDEARELASRDGRRGPGGFGRGVFGRERRRRVVDGSAAVAPFAVGTRAGVAPDGAVHERPVPRGAAKGARDGVDPDAGERVVAEVEALQGHARKRRRDRRRVGVREPATAERTVPHSFGSGRGVISFGRPRNAGTVVPGSVIIVPGIRMIVPGIRIVPGDADAPFAAFLRPPPAAFDHLSDEAGSSVARGDVLHLSPGVLGALRVVRERDVPQR